MVLHQSATHYEPISWDDAFKLIANELHALGSPDEAIFYTSGRASNEAAFLYQLFVRQFGTNNLPDCSNMCHESSGTALSETIGVGKGTVSLEDFELGRGDLCNRSEPGNESSAHADRAAKSQTQRLPDRAHQSAAGNRHDALQTSAADRRPVGQGNSARRSFLQVRINGDVALLKGIMKEILAAEEKSPGRVLDQEFIRITPAGFEEFAAALRKRTGAI